MSMSLAAADVTSTLTACRTQNSTNYFFHEHGKFSTLTSFFFQRQPEFAARSASHHQIHELSASRPHQLRRQRIRLRARLRAVQPLRQIKAGF